MDILISANQTILEFARSVPCELQNYEKREDLVKWFEQMEKDKNNGTDLQEVTV